MPCNQPTSWAATAAARHGESRATDATRITEKARQAGVDCELDLIDEVPHVWQIFAGILPEGQQVLDRAGAFLRRRLGLPGQS